MKWAQITQESQCTQSEKLCEFLQTHGQEASFSLVTANQENLIEKINEAQGQFEALRLGNEFGVEVVKHFDLAPSEVFSLHEADAMTKTGEGQWWLRSYLFKGVHLAISEVGQNIDLNSSALVVGSDAKARAMASGLIKLGFKRMNVSTLNSDEGIEMVNELNRGQFDVKITHIPISNLVTLPGIHGVVANCLSLELKNEDLNSLYYFNFLQKGGVVFDLSQTSSTSLLVKEAIEVGAMGVGQEAFLSARDFFWLEQVFSYKLDRQKYRDFLNSESKIEPEN